VPSKFSEPWNQVARWSEPACCAALSTGEWAMNSGDCVALATTGKAEKVSGMKGRATSRLSMSRADTPVVWNVLAAVVSPAKRLIFLPEVSSSSV
jgi:hypothetical protein